MSVDRRSLPEPGPAVSRTAGCPVPGARASRLPRRCLLPPRPAAGRAPPDSNVHGLFGSVGLPGDGCEDVRPQPRRGAPGICTASFTDSPSSRTAGDTYGLLQPLTFGSLLPYVEAIRTRRTAASPSDCTRSSQGQQSGSYRSKDPETLVRCRCLGSTWFRGSPCPGSAPALPRLCPGSAPASPETGLCPASGGAMQTRGRPPRKNVGWRPADGRVQPCDRNHVVI